MCLFHAVEVERSVFFHECLNHLCSEEVSVVGGMVAEEQFYFSPFFYDDENTPVNH